MSLGSSGFAGGLWVRSNSSGKPRCALGVTGIRLVRLGPPWGSLGSFGFVWFVTLRPGVRSGSSGMSVCTLGVVGFDLVCLVRPGAPWVSLSSFGFVWFVRVLNC